MFLFLPPFSLVKGKRERQSGKFLEEERDSWTPISFPWRTLIECGRGNDRVPRENIKDRLEIKVKKKKIEAYIGNIRSFV